MTVVVLVVVADLLRDAEAGVPDFSSHPLSHRSNGAPAAIWAPPGAPAGSPGFAAIRSFNMEGCDDKYSGPGSGPCGPEACAKPGANCSAPIAAWNASINEMFNNTQEGGLDLAEGEERKRIVGRHDTPRAAHQQSAERKRRGHREM